MFRGLLPCLRELKARSSRRGKEQIRSKTSEEVKVRRSDLRVGANPQNGIRGTRSSQLRDFKCKCTRL